MQILMLQNKILVLTNKTICERIIILQKGKVAERFNAPVLKTGIGDYRGFESLPFRFGVIHLKIHIYINRNQLI